VDVGAKKKGRVHADEEPERAYWREGEENKERDEGLLTSCALQEEKRMKDYERTGRAQLSGRDGSSTGRKRARRSKLKDGARPELKERFRRTGARLKNNKSPEPSLCR